MAMTSSSASSLVFKVERNKPQLICPAEPTPYEFKPLSDIDDQKGFRKQNPIIQFYPYVAAMEGRDPVEVIRAAIAKTLVFYYPFAGRIREGANEKLTVECTGEGIVFTEANAYVTLSQFGEYLHPPFPCADELLFDVPGTSGILHCPMLLIQVTRLLCGGFIFGIRINHSMSDATGLVQFMTALGEIARGASAPSVLPVWERELLNARDTPQVTCVHHAYDKLQPKTTTVAATQENMAHGSFFFGPQEIAALRSSVPAHLQKCSRFDLLTACIWRCRTMALDTTTTQDEEVRVAFPVNARAKFNPPLPAGFYGNGFGLSVALTTANKLCRNPLGYAVELVRRARYDVTEEFMKSLADLLVTNERFRFTAVRTFVVSDLTRIGFTGVDFGWGKALYGGPTWGGAPASFFIASKDHNVEDGVVVTMDLPEPAMKIFASEITRMTTASSKEKATRTPTPSSSPFIYSYL